MKIFPGVRLHFSRSGIGISVGPRGFHIGVSPKGSRYVSAGLPGTGLYVRENLSKRPKP